MRLYANTTEDRSLIESGHLESLCFTWAQIYSKSSWGYWFPTQFIQLVMTFISSFSFSVIVNAQQQNWIKGKEGLR